MSTDEQLVSRALEGSVASFEQLVQRYQDRLLRFLLTRCHSRADAEDALQDTFINAWRYLGSYNPRWRFSTWLYRIALRNAGRTVRAAGSDERAAAREAAVAAASESAREWAAESADPLSVDPLEECIREGERSNLWLAAKRLLPEDCYTAMWLRYGEDMSVRDVARVLGRPSTWVRVVLLRGRRRLRDALSSEPEGGRPAPRKASDDSTKDKLYG